MEDLLINDASYEVYASSEGAELLENRTLMDYPSEKSSFQVFLGFQGDKPKGEKPKVDPQKISDAITSGAGAIGSVASTVQAFQNPAKRELKDVCGRKPLLKKNITQEYKDCVKKYYASKNQPPVTEKDNSQPSTPSIETNKNKTRNIIIGVVAVGVVATVIIGFKQGWFGKK